MPSRAMTGALVAVTVLLVVSIVALVFAVLAFLSIHDNPATLAPFNPDVETLPPRRTTAAPATNADWQDITNMFANSIDESVDPCTDFYLFSCGNWIKNRPAPAQGSLISFGDVDDTIVTKLNATLRLPKNGTAAWGLAVQNGVNAFNSCVLSDPASNDNTNSKSLYKKINGYNGFPMGQSAAWTYNSNWNAFKLAGELAAKYRINTLLTPVIDTNWKSPTQQLIHMMQATLTLQTPYYTTPSIWKVKRALIQGLMTKAGIWYANQTGDALVAKTLAQDVEDMLTLEETLANMSMKATDERDATKLWHPTTTKAGVRNAPFVPVSEMLNQMESLMSTHVPASHFDNFNAPEQSYWVQLSTYLSSVPSNPTKYYRLMQNYMMWRLIYDRSRFIPELKGDYEDLVKASVTSAQTDHSAYCVNVLRDNLPYVMGRVYVDFHFRTLPGNPRDTLHSMINKIMGSFSNMISSLKWMDEATKEIALRKVNAIQRHTNVAYPDWIMSDAALNANASTLGSFKATDHFFDVLDKLTLYQTTFQFVQLTYATNRRNFLSSPAIVNAWYQPELNSISFPAGILNPPFFQAGWPTSVNFGAMGLVMGHELTHGFDDQGVQWTEDGTLAPWIDSSSNTGFKSMAQCVIDEYDRFCFPPGSKNCINGVQTQGENIADNGGIKSAYLAYKNTELLNGVEQRLPGSMAKYTHDQLYFMAFGQVWCRSIKEANIVGQLLNDPHSPAQARVRGAVQNFPAFARAFNCPTGSKMNPLSHCNVW